MASAARSATRAFLRSTPATSSFRPAVRSARFALPAQGFRSSARRGYASEAGQKSGGSGAIWAFALAAAGGAGAYFYLNGESAPAGPFVPTKEDYQKVYDAIAQRLANETDYDDGSYGPVSSRWNQFLCSLCGVVICKDLPTSSHSLSTNAVRFSPILGPRPSRLARQRYLR